MLYGTRISLFVSIASVVASGTVGSCLGLIAGYWGGWVDDLLMRVADIQLSIPFMVLAIVVAAVLGGSLVNIILVLMVTGWVLYARLVRSEVLVVREREFIESARAIGATTARIVIVHVLPNILSSVLVVGTLEVGRMVIAEASLSFLGLGVPPSVPEWGGMIADSRVYLSVAWWAATFPGLAILLTTLGISLLGDWLRVSLDPRQRSG